MRKAVIIYGPPGSGKGTQSELVARTYELINFDTGQRIREAIYDPAHANDPIIQRQRTEYYEKGILCEPWWVFELVCKGIRDLSKVSGIVLSGSPRTIYEAFDEGDRKGEMSILEEVYGKENIHIFLLKVSSEAVTFRNGKRKVCPICTRGYLFQKEADLTTCPVCQSPLQIRTDDDPALMVKRINEFETRTAPIMDGLKKIGYTVHEIDGEQPPYLVFKDIAKWLS